MPNPTMHIEPLQSSQVRTQNGTQNLLPPIYDWLILLLNKKCISGSLLYS